MKVSESYLYRHRHDDKILKPLRLSAEDKADYHIFTRYHGLQQRNPVMHRYPVYRPSKSQQFYLMELMGLKVVEYKTVKLWQQSSREETHIVVYLDENEHASEGKALLTIVDACILGYEDKLASLFINSKLDEFLQRREHPDDIEIVSYRFLVIGDMVFELKINSDHSWMTNKGNSKYKLLKYGRAPSEHSKLLRFYTAHRALFALDFILQDGERVYIDFNTAPGIPKEVSELLSEGNLMSELINWYDSNPVASPI